MLGADDAIVSTASLMLGVAASSATRTSILVAGIAGLVAGALSMAAGEYVSVSSQRDAEQADIAREKRELRDQPDAELEELTQIYLAKGLSRSLAREVAEQLSARDGLGAHLREELGIDPNDLARPFQAAWISALSFGSFALVPILALVAAPASVRMETIALVSLLCLAVLGAAGAAIGGAPRVRGALRVVAGGGIAMGVTAVIGRIVGVSLG
jgi:VIT1/CCC1 family predicted Fe2+/Mn2+ transporter